MKLLVIFACVFITLASAKPHDSDDDDDSKNHQTRRVLKNILIKLNDRANSNIVKGVRDNVRGSSEELCIICEPNSGANLVSVSDAQVNLNRVADEINRLYTKNRGRGRLSIGFVPSKQVKKFTYDQSGMRVHDLGNLNFRYIAPEREPVYPDFELDNLLGSKNRRPALPIPQERTFTGLDGLRPVTQSRPLGGIKGIPLRNNGREDGNSDEDENTSSA